MAIKNDLSFLKEDGAVRIKPETHASFKLIKTEVLSPIGKKKKGPYLVAIRETMDLGTSEEKPDTHLFQEKFVLKYMTIKEMEDAIKKHGKPASTESQVKKETAPDNEQTVIRDPVPS